MRKAHLAGLLFAVAFLSTTAHAAGGNITGVIGFRQLDRNQWDPTDTQGMLGVLADFSYWDFPLHIELGLRGSEDSGDIGGSHVRQTVGDFSAGVLLIPDYGYVRPYFGGGIANATVEARIEDNTGRETDDDSSAGYYLAGGILWRPTPNFDIGLDVRYLGGTSMRIFGNDVDVDSYTVGLRVGYGWDLYRRNYEPERRRRRPY